MLAAGDGALGMWKAIRDVFAETKEQRCWWHKIGNVLAALPKSAHPGAKKALAENSNAENKQLALKAAKAFAADPGAKWPKAAAKSSNDLDVLLAFYDLPGEHWIHLRTTNPIEFDLRDRQAAAAGHQGARLPYRRHRHGVQAHRVRPGPLAHRERPAPGRAGPRGRDNPRTARSSSEPTTREVTPKPHGTQIDGSCLLVVSRSASSAAVVW